MKARMLFVKGCGLFLECESKILYCYDDFEENEKKGLDDDDEGPI